MRKVTLAIVAIITCGTAWPQAEPLTLHDAVGIALESNPQRKAVLAQTHVARAEIREAKSAFLPRLNFAETLTRSNDPVYVFGTRLRQSRFTAADFALNQLNNPTPIGNFATRFTAQWNLFDSFASRLNLQRARQTNDAATERLSLADQQTIFRAIEAYYGVLIADRQLEVAQQAEATARAVTEESRVRVQSGTAVDSDLLTAQVNLATRQEELVRARNAASLARAQLNMSLGISLDRDYQFVQSLAERKLPEVALKAAEEQAIRDRADLKQMFAQIAAQKTGVRLAKSAFGPRLNAFATAELDNAAFLSNGGNNWLAGVELQFDLFAGGQKRARLSREQALLEEASANKQAIADNIRLEVRRAFYEWDGARQTLEVAHAAVAQADESLRISRNRYEAGLVTITELLRTEDAVRSAQLSYWDAVYRYNVSYAALEFATGSLSARSEVAQ